MATNGAAVVEDWAGITFGVELYVPWDALEAVVDISSVGVVPLRHIPDVIGRREGAAESRVLQGRDVRSVRVLVPDCRGVDQNFHDVTIVDMGDVPESHIPFLELSQQWPPVVISHMGWRQQELEEIRAAAKKWFRQSRPSCCMYCGVLIKCDMYGQIRWWLSTRGFRRMCCCLVTSTCPWCTTTESTSAVFLILLSGGTICHSYALCCRCRQSRQWSVWYRLTLPARVRCVRPGLRRS